MEKWAFWERELSKPRHVDPKRLLRYGYRVYSQNDEDGIIAEIFNRVGVEHHRFVEFGVETGIECNTLRLLLDGWQGTWAEGRTESVERIAVTHRQYLESGALRLTGGLVTAENINDQDYLFRAGRGVDLLSIDIDGNDYWVWKALTVVQPRVVIIEYNATWRPPMSITIPYDVGYAWNGTNYFGASLEALTALGRSKGYTLVGCCVAGVNAFFVRNDLVGDQFLGPFTAEEHYEPPRYFLSQLGAGHPPGFGPLVVNPPA